MKNYGSKTTSVKKWFFERRDKKKNVFLTKKKAKNDSES